MRDVPQAASLSGYLVKRHVLEVLGIVFLSIGGIGIVVGLGWLTAGHVQGRLPNIFDERAEALLYTLPALLLLIAIVGAGFIAAALSTPPGEGRGGHGLHRHTRFHA